MNSERLIILADLGRVRALMVREAGDDPGDVAHLVEMEDGKAEHHPAQVREVATDQAGRFGRSAPVDRRTGMSCGEHHELEAALEMEAVRWIASRIESIVRARGNPRWVLVAPQPVLGMLENALPPAVLTPPSRTVCADLTRHPLVELEHRFLGKK